MPAPAISTQRSSQNTNVGQLKEFIRHNDPRFLPLLQQQTLEVSVCEDMLLLSSLRKRAAQRGLTAAGVKSVRVAILGGYTPFPLSDLIEHFLAAGVSAPWRAEFLLGDYDNYISEIMEESGRL